MMERRWAMLGIPGVAAAIMVTERKCDGLAVRVIVR